MEPKKQDIGGQAVIEGVMMRSKDHIVTAIRKNRKIIYKKDKLKKKSKFAQLFFIRGVVNLVEMLVIGIKTLNWSASQSVGEDEELSDWAIALTLIIAFLFGIGLFLLLPYLLTYLVGVKETQNPIWFNVIDGIIKVAILVLYVYFISKMKDIRRVFQYHGAEHKAVFCYEHNKKLTVENAKQYSTLHPRCGTAFMMIVIIIGIFLFSFIPFIVESFYPSITSLNWALKRLTLFTARILLLPIIAGLAYEALKFGAKHQDNLIFSSLTIPGLWIQKITTQKPSKQQLEVAIAALKKVLELENGTIRA
ncbi:MAG: DUF1385 domain-containing protein [Nanoarchaeota archaeon]|nr:DUF1385 domain-containing protein [Nanoarchaeota archaeon]MBU1005447.1 DUF1385 domain-containing protein [Nanoarchaeota archaeon]MBU1946757.1 DUF1385 domain-containing protein [Nanoarchaeota archaeon]